MKKTVLLCMLTLLLGAAAGMLLNLGFMSGEGLLAAPTVPPAVTIPAAGILSPSDATTSPDPQSNTALLGVSGRVLTALKEGDYALLSGLVHPELGVAFTPYSTVDQDTDLSFTAAQVSAWGENHEKYTWGIAQGTGFPIQCTVQDYLSDFVWDMDYTKAPILGVDFTIANGNSLENVSEAYPGDRYVEYYSPGTDPKNAGLDWSALKLVFADWNGSYRLVGVIHSEWTI